MKIEHIAIWTKQLEVLKRFYEDYFGASSNSKYHNTTSILKITDRDADF